MGKSLGDIEHVFDFFVKDDAGPFSEGGAVRAAVDSDVKYFSAGDADKLPLRMVFLEMEAAQHALGGGAFVVLDKFTGDAGFFEEILLIGFHEVAAGIAMDIGINDDDAGNLGCFEAELFH